MKVIDILSGEVTTVVCKPISEELIQGKRIQITNGKNVITTSHFFVTFSKPCFSSDTTMFINFTTKLPIDMSSVIEFI